MSPEIYTIIGVAIALAALILNGQRFTANPIAELRQNINALRDRVNGDISALGERVNGDISALGERVNGDISALGERVNGDISALGEQVNALVQRVSRVEGLLEGIRDSIRDRAA